MANYKRAKKYSNGTDGLIKASLIGAAIGLVCVIVFSLAAAAVISKADFPHRVIMPVSMVILALSSLIAGITAGAIYHRRALIVGAVVAAVVLTVVLIGSFFLPDENLGASPILKAAVTVLPAIIGAVISVNLPRKDKF